MKLEVFFLPLLAERQMRLVKYLTFLGISNRGRNVEKLIILNEETLQNLYAKAWGSFPSDGRVFV